MRKLIAILVGMTFAVVGSLTACGQVPPNPTVFSCPAATGTTYTPLDASSPATTVAYTDATPAPNEYCYIAQSVNSASTPEGVSVPSNIAGPIAVVSGKSVDLTGNAPVGGVTPTGYVFSRAVAVSGTITAPSLGPGTVAVSTAPAIALPSRELAQNAPIRLKAKLK